MKKNIIKISLDIIMALILLLLYNSHAVSMAFHEAAGLFIFGLFIVHILLNKKWVASISSKLFHKSITPRTRFVYVIDTLLLISFILIIVSGILTSQVLFPFLSAGKDSPWRNIHHFFSAVSIVLVGIHLGLHWNFVSGMLKKAVKLPSKVAKPLSICLLAVILIYGIYSLGTSSFTEWLTAPFISEASHEEPPSGNPAEEKPPETSTEPGSGTSADENQVKDDENRSSMNTALLPTATNDAEKEDDSETGDHTPKSGENKGGNVPGSNTPKAEEGQNSGSAENHPAGENKTAEGSPTVIANTISTYLSILGVFTAITYYLDKFISKRKKK